MKFYNAFGIKPTNTYTSAGTDYYIPNLDTPEKVALAYKAFEKSYGKTIEEVRDIAVGDKVKVTIRFRGRELAHTELGYDVLNEVLKRLTSAYNIDKPAAMDGRNMSMTISAKAAK